jgi:hypothetical protein
VTAPDPDLAAELRRRQLEGIEHADRQAERRRDQKDNQR